MLLYAYIAESISIPAYRAALIDRTKPRIILALSCRFKST